MERAVHRCHLTIVGGFALQAAVLAVLLVIAAADGEHPAAQAAAAYTLGACTALAAVFCTHARLDPPRPHDGPGRTPVGFR